MKYSPKLIQREQYWGIKEDGEEVVPTVHLTKEGAIEEWEYFQRKNFESQFLAYKRTLEQIYELAKQLKGRL